MTTTAETLNALYADVSRLLAAGASPAAKDAGLRQRAKELRELSARVLASAPVPALAARTAAP